MLPNRALIICDNPTEAHELLDFLAECGARWDRSPDDDSPNNMYYGSCTYGELKGVVLCYSLRDNKVSYCYPAWYHDTQRRDEWENQMEPMWNYMSVPEFIRLCGGSPSCDETTVSLEGLL